MKRPRLARAVSVVVLALVVAVTLATAACGGSNTTSSGSPSAATSQAVASLSVAASPSATPLPTPTVAGTIAFERVEPVGHGEIFRVNTSGTGLKRLAADDEDSLETSATAPFRPTEGGSPSPLTLGRRTPPLAQRGAMA